MLKHVHHSTSLLSAFAYPCDFSLPLPQWAILCSGFWKIVQDHRARGVSATREPFHRIPLDFVAFIDAHFIGATVLISVGTVLGRISPTQKVLLVLIEVIVAAAYLAILVDLKVIAQSRSRSSSAA